MGAPADILGHFRICRVLAENRLGIREFSFSES